MVCRSKRPGAGNTHQPDSTQPTQKWEPPPKIGRTGEVVGDAGFIQRGFGDSAWSHDTVRLDRELIGQAKAKFA
jgi:hypothetical protein